MSKKSLSAAILLVCLEVSSNHAQAPKSNQKPESLNGFTIGMSRDSVASLLKGRVLSIAPDQERDNSFFIRRAGAPTGDWLVFCGNELHSYVMEIRGGVDAFVRYAATEDLRRGTGRYEARSTETSTGLQNSLRVRWPGDLELTLTRFGGVELVHVAIFNPSPCKELTSQH